MIRNSAGLSNVESESTNLMLPVKDIGELFQLAERLDESRQIKEEFVSTRWHILGGVFCSCVLLG